MSGKDRTRKRMYGTAAVAILLLFSITACTGKEVQEDTAKEETETADDKETESALRKTAQIKQITESIAEEKQAEDGISSYLQGIKSFEKGLDWTGDWCNIEAGGQQFSQFGCGVCCLANMCSSLTDSHYNPKQMYEYAKEESGYDPDSGVGAIGWQDMKLVLEKNGLNATLGIKPASYEEFCTTVGNAATTLVLVSSSNDDTIWQDLPGHYVNLWLYNGQTDEVFLTDSKGPKRNRQWVKLSYIYDALKTSSDYQYLTIQAE